MPMAVDKSPPGTKLRLHVCPLDRLNEIVHASSATHVMSLINQQNMPPTPPKIAPGNHLKLALNDISMPLSGLVHPATHHISNLLSFADAWGAQTPIVIHCWAGISRSTAAAFITLCKLNPDANETDIARALRQASPTAQPNPLMVALADEALNRRGRMIKAITQMDDAQMAEAVPFFMPLTLPVA